MGSDNAPASHGEPPPPTNPAHRQASHAVRFEWGAEGAAAIVPGAAFAVVVDVLSFTTAVTVAVERGMAVYPYRWRDASAQEYAAARGAVLAAGRREGIRDGRPSLSPASLLATTGIDSIVLPSPNGSSISHALSGSGATVLAASLRNAAAVAQWLAGAMAEGEAVAVVAAGERWPDGSLRPAVEDLWGAGAVIAGLVDRGVGGPGGLSPEASTAAAAHRAAAADLAERLTDCASGRELVDAGFERDVAIAAQADTSSVVPLLHDGAFRAMS